MNRLSPWFLSAFLGVGVFLPAVVLSQAPTADPAPPSNQQTTQKPQKNSKKKQSTREIYKELDTPYKKWLSEDVAYIITDEERKAFLQLNADDERQQFIEQFWLRRDPTPDTE